MAHGQGVRKNHFVTGRKIYVQTCQMVNHVLHVGLFFLFFHGSLDSLSYSYYECHLWVLGLNEVDLRNLLLEDSGVALQGICYRHGLEYQDHCFVPKVVHSSLVTLALVSWMLALWSPEFRSMDTRLVLFLPLHCQGRGS